MLVNGSGDTPRAPDRSFRFPSIPDVLGMAVVALVCAAPVGFVARLAVIIFRWAWGLV